MDISALRPPRGFNLQHSIAHWHVHAEEIDDTKNWVKSMNDKILKAMEKSDDEFKHAEPAKETRVLKKIKGHWTLSTTRMSDDEFLELTSEIRSVNRANDILIGMA
jgi:hypothetical protein